MKIEIDIERKGEDGKDVTLVITKDGKEEMKNHIIFNTKYGVEKYISVLWNDLMGDAICSSYK